MIKRKNIIFEMAAKKGIEMCRDNHFNSARQMLEKTGLPPLVIERLLYEPHNTRSHDHEIDPSIVISKNV